MQRKPLIAIDFGCIKEVPDAFYIPYFELARKEIIENDVIFEEKLYELEILTPTDSEKERLFFKALFKELLTLFTFRLMRRNSILARMTFWGHIADLSQRYSKDEHIRKMNGSRGSKHFLYINRTFFGLYNLLHDLKAKVVINNYKKYL